MTTQEREPLHCAGGCDRTAVDETDAEHQGWEYLSITGRYRCGACLYELRKAGETKESE